MNHEFDLFEARMHMIGDVVDVFVLHEANVTNDGRPKEPLFFNKFNQGWLSGLAMNTAFPISKMAYIVSPQGGKRCLP